MKRSACEPVTLAFLDSAPVRLVNSLTIAATPEQVWAALEDASAWPRWASVITKVEWTSPRPFGVGTTRTVSMVAGMTGYEEFLAWQPHQQMAFRFNEATLQGVSAFAEGYTLEAVTPSSTRVTWVMAMRPTGISTFILGVTSPVMRLVLGRFLGKLRRLVEAEYVTAPR